MKYCKKKTKNLSWTNKRWCIQGSFWTWLSRFLFHPSTLCHNITVLQSLSESSASSASFFTLFLWHLNEIFWITQFDSIYCLSKSKYIYIYNRNRSVYIGQTLNCYRYWKNINGNSSCQLKKKWNFHDSRIDLENKLNFHTVSLHFWLFPRCVTQFHRICKGKAFCC